MGANPAQVEFWNFIPSLIPGMTLQEFLQATADPKILPAQLVQRVNDDPEFKAYLVQAVSMRKKSSWDAEEQKTEKKEEKKDGKKDGKGAPEAAPPSEAEKPNFQKDEKLFHLIGRGGVRNLYIAHRLKKVFNLEKDLDPRQALNHAIYAEEFCQDRYIAYPDYAYFAGLHFDWLGVMFDKDKATQAKAYLEEIWTKSLKTAVLSYQFGLVAPPGFKYEKELFAAGLVVELGKVLMSYFFKQDHKPTWKEYQSKCSRVENKHKTDLYNFFLEKRSFPITHNEFSSVLVNTMKFLRPVEAAIYYYREPYMLQMSNKELFVLAVILKVASEINVKNTKIGETDLKFLQKAGFQEAKLTQAIDKTRKMLSGE